MGARRLRVGTSVVALGFVLAMVFGALGVGSGTKAYGAGTTLTVISGDVLVLHAGAADFTLAADGEVLNEGDVVRTGAEGRAILTYFEGSTVTVEPATELAIDNAWTSADGSTIVVMTQAVGRTWHVVTKLITGGSKYEVRTPASTASVRGTEFQVDSDHQTTTVSTTEGTVLAKVQDQTGATVDVPVTAGTQQVQPVNAPPAPAEKAPEPERRVTITVESTNTLVVDPLGRANGVTKDGKLVVQTPGAQVKKVGNTVVVTLPNLPDGKVSTQVDDDRDRDVAVQTKVEDKGGKTVVVEDTARSDSSAKRETKRSGVEITKTANGQTQGRVLDSSEKKDLPAAKTAEPRPSPSATPRSETQAPDATRGATETPRVSATPRAIETARASATPRVTETPRATETPRGSATPERSAETRAPSVEPSATRRPTEAPATSRPPSRVEQSFNTPLQRASETPAPTAAPRAPAPTVIQRTERTRAPESPRPTERGSTVTPPNLPLPHLPTTEAHPTRKPKG